MRKTLDPSALYWALFNRFELRISGEAVTDICHSGSNDEAVDYWKDKVMEQVITDDFANKPTPDTIRAELKEYGAWDGKELADDELNWQRLVWIAAWNIFDDDAQDCSQPLKTLANA